MKSGLLFYTLFILSVTVSAEYRVFTLLLTNEKTKVSRQIQTTLDPEQYIGFFPLNAGENITYVSTWMCRSRTEGFKSHCENPHLTPALADSQVRGLATDSSQSPEVP